MKVIFGLLAASLLFAACEKNKFETKPKIEVRSATPEVVTVGQKLLVSIRFFDKEGDVNDSIYVVRRRENRRDVSAGKTRTIELAIPDFPNTQEGEIDINMEYARHLTFSNSTIPLPGGKVEPDTLSFRFFVKDAAGNRSDTAILDKKIIVIR